MAEYPKKLFKYDKNYILKEAQSACRKKLLQSTVHTVKHYYLLHYNPLGLEDDSILKIKRCKKYDLSSFDEFYECLAGIYRYKHGDNQLEILFDGINHFEYYQNRWIDYFNSWIQAFLRHENFIKAILEAAIFYPGKRKALLANNRLKIFLNNYFEVKVYKYRGIVPIKSA